MLVKGDRLTKQALLAQRNQLLICVRELLKQADGALPDVQAIQRIVAKIEKTI